MKFPLMAKIKQNFDTATIADIAGEIHSELTQFDLQKVISPGQSVAITAGSRGICKIADILRALVNELERIQAKPSATYFNSLPLSISWTSGLTY